MRNLISAMSKHGINNNEYYDGSKASTSKFFGAVACNNGSKKIVHVV